MNPTIASLICAAGIAGLLYLNREQTRVSPALWLPVIWLAIVGSRSVSAWFDLNPTRDAPLDGSPLDAALYGLLLAIAILVLIGRKDRTRTLLFANWAILIYFVYCLISVTWSYYPDVALKRWIKSLGDLAMVLIIATEANPIEAIRRTASRVGFLLLPTSVLLITYFSELGRAYNADGVLMNTGVTTNKNMLGLTVLMISLVTVWNLRSLFANKSQPNRGRRLLAQSVLLAFGLVLFWMADSSTCIACFLLGTFLMLVTGRSVIRKGPRRVHALCLGIVLAAGITMFWAGQSGVTEALGREATMSGRTVIWPAVIRAAVHPIIGAGFESFWVGPNVEAFRQDLLDQGWYPLLVENLNEAHNGYIETYLNLGWIGLGLIATILVVGYRRSVKVFHQAPELGGFMLSVIAVAAVYSIAEAGFRNLNPAWIFLLLVLVSASGLASGLIAIPASGLVLAKDSRAAARVERNATSLMLTPPARADEDRTRGYGYLRDRWQHRR